MEFPTDFTEEEVQEINSLDLLEELSALPENYHEISTEDFANFDNNLVHHEDENYTASDLIKKIISSSINAKTSLEEKRTMMKL